MSLDFAEIRQLLATIAQTDITEVTLKSDEFEITVRKSGIVNNQISLVESKAPSPQVVPTAPTDLGTTPVIDTTTAAQQPSAPPGKEQKGVEVTSPMVGTFYRAPAPGEVAFVEVGDRVRSGQTVCIIEAMKLMNEIEAEVSGQVIEILVQNGEPVEYGQALMRINPD
ncbi:MAG: acetyl-CoA carboxylase biotin carboxyl carrier protein [Nostocaceae cyanobacterium]|nr:acetyl-CoA carboxylase biotin carboxyl carrier protein [Nostocaceae cyanobacterium]